MPESAEFSESNIWRDNTRAGVGGTFQGFLRASVSLFRIGLMQLDRKSGFANSDIEDFNKYGEAHCEVDVTLRNVLPKTVSDQCDAYQQKETKSQHLNGWMAFDKAANGPGKEHHEDDRYNDSSDHYRNVVDHSDGSDDRVERENNVEEDDLNDDGAK